MNAADLAVIAVYAAIVIWVGYRSTARTHTAEDLFLAARGLGFGVIGLSLFASNISSTTLIGLAGAAYDSGLAVVNYEWMAALVLLFAAFVLVPTYLRGKLRTVPEYVGDKFGEFARRYVAAFMIGLSILVDTAGSLFAGAIVITVFVPGLELLPTVIGLALFAGIYTISGGLRAVMLTDVLQAGALIASSVAITVIVLAQFDFSWTRIVAALPPDRLSLIRPADDPDMPWTGLLTGVPILGLYYWTMNHYIAQRFFAARDLGAAQRGAMLGAALKLLPLFIMVLPGALAVSLFPGLARGDEVYPTLVRELLPAGLRGLAIAGIIAALMSTIDSTINAASAMISFDFLRIDRRPGVSAQRQLLLARGVTAALLVIAVAWAPVIQSFPGLFNYLQQMFAVAAPPIAAVILLATLGLRLAPGAAVSAMICGHVLGVLLAGLALAGHWPLHFLETAGVVFIASAAVALVGCRRDSGARHVLSPWTAGWREAAPGVRGAAIAILAAVAAMLVVLH
jgi:solute:Na+ symporter, SSS family